MAECVAGAAYIKVNARSLSLRGTLTISPNQITRSPISGLDGFHGYQAVWRAPYIEIEITNRPQFPLSDLAAITNATVTAELEAGPEVWVLRNAFQSGDLELNAADGTCTVRFEGPEMRRQRG
jgi:hypothetical protein